MTNQGVVRRAAVGPGEAPEQPAEHRDAQGQAELLRGREEAARDPGGPLRRLREHRAQQRAEHEGLCGAQRHEAPLQGHR